MTLQRASSAVTGARPGALRSVELLRAQGSYSKLAISPGVEDKRRTRSEVVMSNDLDFGLGWVSEVTGQGRPAV